ncbi:MAG: MarR family transcriptional regulator [Rhodospirillaceae bacterium]|nr:MAG: MarR family transcriptional regulator [Rhodospirillaceae bacterium]
MPLSNTFNTEKALTSTLTRLSRRWCAQLNEELKETGLSQSRLNILLCLSHHGEGVAQKDIAEHIGVKPPTIGRLLDSLEEMRLVTRPRSPDDRRVRTVYLTPAARSYCMQAEKISAKLRHKALSGLTSDSLEDCLAVFNEVLINLDGGNP